MKDGTKIILFALGTEDTSVTGVITGHWSTMSGVLMYECHPSGKVARVEFSNFCFSTVFYGEIENLPEPEEGTIYIVSAMVLAAAKEKGRTDVVHPDCIRKDGFIVSVPGFVR